MKDTLARHQKVSKGRLVATLRSYLGKANNNSVKAVNDEGVYLVSFARKTTLVDLHEAVKHLYGESSCKKHGRKISSPENISNEIVGLLGIDSTRVLIRIIRNKMVEIGVCNIQCAHVRLEIAASAYIYSYPVPSLNDLHDGTAIIVPKSSLRRAERVVAKNNFYKHPLRQDDVMI